MVLRIGVLHGLLNWTVLMMRRLKILALRWNRGLYDSNTAVTESIPSCIYDVVSCICGIYEAWLFGFVILFAELTFAQEVTAELTFAKVHFLVLVPDQTQLQTFTWRVQVALITAVNHHMPSQPSQLVIPPNG